jgi:hypothetical protein
MKRQPKTSKQSNVHSAVTGHTDGKSKNEWRRIGKQELGKYKARGAHRAGDHHHFRRSKTEIKARLGKLDHVGGHSSLCPSTRLRP